MLAFQIKLILKCIYKELNNNKQLQNLQKAKDYAQRRCGVCLSEAYVNNKEKLSWKCNKEDHPVWFALPKIANRETWCICCSRESRKTLKINT